MAWLAWINQFIITPAVPVCLMGAGLWYGGVLRFFWLRSPRILWRVLLHPAAKEGVSPASAMTVALAGTLGVGNIVGVASAIVLGGPGAIFWMWVSALCAMVLKYAEITLALRHRRQTADGQMLGGAMYYIADCAAEGRLGRRGGRVIGSIFAILCLINGLTMGSVIQVRAVSSAFGEMAGVPPLAVGLGMAALTLPALRRGMEGVAKLTERLIPLASAAYVIVSLLALFRLRAGIPAAFAAIFGSAFTPSGAAGGVVGFLLSRSVRFGTMRGLLSNEAGCGTAPTAHAESSARCPAEQGVWGIVEVFVDTILLCTMTALVILASGVEPTGMDGMLLTLDAYTAAIGSSAGWFLSLSILVFAYATVLCWAHYGRSCVRWFGEGKGGGIFFYLIYAASISIGSVAAPDAIWQVADFSLGTMTLINLFALCLLMPEVKAETAAPLHTHGVQKRGTSGRECSSGR